jgi:transposase-like protein
MMENGKRRRRRQLTPEEKWEIFLEKVTSQEISQADAARKYGVDVSVIIRLRALAKDAALAAFASSKPGRPASAEEVELELLRAENDRLSEALKELAVELSLHRGRQRSGYSARSPRA